MMPKGIQRKRTGGWRKPDGAVDVTRSTKWGNPFEQTMRRTVFAEMIENLDVERKYRILSRVPAKYVELTLNDRLTLYRAYILFKTASDVRHYNLEELRGRDLMCWCSIDAPCHRNILLELANR